MKREDVKRDKRAGGLFVVSPALAGQTLAGTLRLKNPGLSWTDAKRLVAQRKVRINGNLTLDDARRLRGGETVEILAQSGGPPPREDDVVVRYLDADLVVIEKPPGVTTLRHAEERDWSAERKNRQPTLEELVQRVVRTRLPQVGGVKPKPSKRHLPGPRRPMPPQFSKPKPIQVRPVHRLDRETSGLMVFALSPAAEVSLVRMFKSHAVKRAYWAVVLGAIDQPRKIETLLVRDRGDGLRGSSTGGPEAKRAVTRIAPLQQMGPDFTAIRCELETGRTHQIRIHLAEIGHMLCGERVYTRAAAGAAQTSDPSRAPRVALHSSELELTHPGSGKLLRFTSPVPKDLADWYKALQARSR